MTEGRVVPLWALGVIKTVEQQPPCSARSR